MQENQVSRRTSIALILSFASYLLSQLTGCGGGGGGGTPPNTSQRAFTVTVNGTSQQIVLATQNPTALALTQAASSNIETDATWRASFGLFVQGIGGRNYAARDNGSHWKLYKNSQWATQSADQLRLNPGDTIEWRLES